MQPILNAVVGVEAHQGGMLARAHRDIPVVMGDISGIERLIEQLRDALCANLSAAVLREERVALQEADDIGLQFEASRGKAFKGFFDNRGGGLTALEHLTATWNTLEAVADGWLKRPVAVQQAAAHPVLRLLAILLPLVLRHAGKEVLNEPRVRIVAKLNRRGFQKSACVRDFSAKLEVRFKTAREARDIVDDHDGATRAMFPKLCEHRFHARAARQATGDVITKNVCHLVAFAARELAAARLLRFQAIAFNRLLDAGHAGVDYRLSPCAFYAGHSLPAFLLMMIDGVSLSSQRRL